MNRWMRNAWIHSTWIHKLAMGVFGWLVPGGGYLFERGYLRFGASSAVICAVFAAGIVLQGDSLWIAPDELAGVDGFTSLVARAGVVGKALAGLPYLLARVFYHSQNYTNGRLHEYGTILLLCAGLINFLALADAFEIREGGDHAAS